MVDEQKETQGEGEKKTASDNYAGATSSLIEEARRERQAMEEIANTLRKERERIERVQADIILSGKSYGKPKEEVQKIETPKEYKERVLSGKI